MLSTAAPNAEPIAGYRLLEPLGQGGFGEVWKCEAPGGLFKAIKFVHSDTLGGGGDPADDELRALQRIKALRHPFLLSIERIEVIDGVLLLVTELADKSLRDVLAEYQDTGRPGVPRRELLRYLREAAEVLDLLNLRHNLQHLDIKPPNLFLVCDHVKLGDFGLVRSLGELGGPNKAAALGAVTPRYGAPELFRGEISPTSDQYSLAVVYQELLTGTLPFDGKNSRQLAMQHTHDAPNLAALAAADAQVLARALAKDPAARFPNCLALVEALEADRDGGESAAGPAPAAVKRPAVGKYLPNLDFLEQETRTPTLEVWAARTKEGRRKQVKVLIGSFGRTKTQVQKSLDLLKQITHSGLAQTQVLPGKAGSLIVVTDQYDCTLRDRYDECRDHGAKGLLRRQLLDWLTVAAETLDDLAKQHRLAHLRLNPRNLLLDGDRLLLADFGPAALFPRAGGSLDAQGQRRYSAPELLDGRATPSCDQYSLAVIYQEMLTGAHPLRGGPDRPPNLDPLSAAEREVVARALSRDPEQRFASCTELVWALEEADPGVRITRTNPRVDTVREHGRANEALAVLIGRAAAATPPAGPPEWVAQPSGALALECRFNASLPPPSAGPQAGEIKFESFRQQWNAELRQSGNNSLTYRVPVSRRFWQRWFGSPAGVVVEIRWTRPRPPLHLVPQVIVRVCAEDGRRSESVLREIAPLLADSIGAVLRGHGDRRRSERLVWAHPVSATPLSPDGQRGEPIEAQGKDISLDGMGLYLPRVLSGTRLDLWLTSGTAEPPLALAGNLVRVQRCGDGWFEAGVLFE
jgi:serine/threonine protein kinase